MTISGSCQCGSVRYQIKGEFRMMGNCHCSICRKTHGAAYATWGLLNPEQFQWTAGMESLNSYASSPGRLRYFCRHCGAPLASSHHGQVGEVVVGSLDGDPGVRPSEHIFVRSKAIWHDITDALPQHAHWPPGMEENGEIQAVEA